jgi:hypothetical protein
MAMNHRERRAARTREAIFIDHCRLLQGHPNYGLPVNCWLCSAPHSASGLARIRDKGSTSHLPLCHACLAGADMEDRMARKYFNAPRLEIGEGGEATPEQIAALADKQDMTEH